MRLLIVSHFYEGHGGGIEKVAAQLGRALSRLGHAVDWAASDADPLPPDAAAVPLRCLDLAERLTGLPMPIPGPSAIVRLARAVRSSDAVIINDALYVTSIIAMLFAKANGKPVVLIQHIAGIAFASRVMRVLMWLANATVTRPMLAVADHLVFISDVVRREMIGEPARRSFKLLFNGVDTAIFHPEPAADRRAIRARFKVPADLEFAIFVGRFVEKKGLSILRALAAMRPDLHFVIVGDGPIRPERWNLANVQVLGRQYQNNVAALYGAADLLVLPSVGEGFPLVVQEAMACGLPILCGDETTLADPHATSFLHGVAINLGDPMESALRCSERIDHIRSRHVDLSQMATYAAAHYSWPKMAEEVIACLSRSSDPFHMTSSRLELP